MWSHFALFSLLCSFCSLSSPSLLLPSALVRQWKTLIHCNLVFSPLSMLIFDTTNLPETHELNQLTWVFLLLACHIFTFLLFAKIYRASRMATKIPFPSLCFFFSLPSQFSANSLYGFPFWLNSIYLSCKENVKCRKERLQYRITLATMYTRAFLWQPIHQAKHYRN